MFGPLLAALSIPRDGPGRLRSRPDQVLGDKAYSFEANRQLLRKRGITGSSPSLTTRSDTAVAAAPVVAGR